MRDVLLSHLLDGGYSQCQSVAEFWVPGSNERADLVLLGPGMHGFEIKSRRDNLERLPRQVAAYGRVFDRCTAVVHSRHLLGTTRMLPGWWGVIEVDERDDFRSVREAGANPTAKRETVVQLLWKEEARQILAGLGFDVPADEPRAALWLRLLAVMDLAYLHGLVGQVLADRDWGASRYGTRRRSDVQLPSLASS